MIVMNLDNVESVKKRVVVHAYVPVGTDVVSPATLFVVIVLRM